MARSSTPTHDNVSGNDDISLPPVDLSSMAPARLATSLSEDACAAAATPRVSPWAVRERAGITDVPGLRFGPSNGLMDAPVSMTNTVEAALASRRPLHFPWIYATHMAK